jgi:hypothetical protein
VIAGPEALAVVAVLLVVVAPIAFTLVLAFQRRRQRSRQDGS